MLSETPLGLLFVEVDNDNPGRVRGVITAEESFVSFVSFVFPTC